MGQVSYVVSGSVNDGDGAAFTAVAKKASAAAKKGEPNTLVYDWHLADDGGSYVIVETFKDDAALQHHVQHMTENGILAEFAEKASIDRVQVLTPVSDASKEILKGFGATFMSRSAGLDS